jgi:hypothetical protein
MVISILQLSIIVSTTIQGGSPSPPVLDRCMSGLNDRGLQWFPRDCVINHALEITHGMRRECGVDLTMTRQRALRHTRISRSRRSITE